MLALATAIALCLAPGAAHADEQADEETPPTESVAPLYLPLVGK